MNGTVRRYAPAGATLKAFHESPAFVRAIMGPIGSGKSTACVIEILRRAAMQQLSPDGIRRSRWAIIRNSYPELKSTTLKTWTQWSPPEFGKINFDSPITQHVKTDDLDLEVLFLALDRSEDQRKLLSLELTGAWINEAREIEKPILDALTGRVGRYPSRMQGGATWSGVLLDTNPPTTEHWWYRLAEEETPIDWAFFRQPAGDGPDAENVENLPEHYYKRAKAGKDDDWIKVYVRGEYGFVLEGRPVFPSFRDAAHTAAQAFPAAPGIALMIGVDFGLSPAAVIGQKLPDGRWWILDELVAENSGILRFGETLAAYLRRQYPEHQVGVGFGDPAGNQRAQTDERTALDIIRQTTGWRWIPAPSNDATMRLEVVSAALNRMIDGKPGFVLSPRCAMLRKGFAGGYHFRPVRSGSGTTYHEAPSKNAYSHPHDALQYLLLGGGEHDVVLNRSRHQSGRGPRFAAGVDYNVLAT
jgi:hypothetical protein